ncbi:MAG: PLDc N-terminal domain-containing protein [Ekhidna sp.]
MYNVLSIVALLCAIWVIYEVWTKQKMSTGSKIIWTIFAILFNIVTAIVFYFMKKR